MAAAMSVRRVLGKGLDSADPTATAAAASRGKRRLSTGCPFPSVSSISGECTETLGRDFRSNHAPRVPPSRSHRRSYSATPCRHDIDIDEHGTGTGMGDASRIRTDSSLDFRDKSDPEWETDRQQLDELLLGVPIKRNNGEGANPFRHREYQNVWKASRTKRNSSNNNNNNDKDDWYPPTALVPLEFRPRLDRHSRFLLQLLQNLYQVGLTHTHDRVTTERCNAMLEKLANPNDDNDNDRDGNAEFSPFVDHWQRVERARAILECMELFVPLRKRGSIIPVDLPVPSHDSYSRILGLYGTNPPSVATPRGSSHESVSVSAQRCRKLESEAPMHARAIVERLDRRIGDVSDYSLVGPCTSWHWNQVLACHASAASRPNRPVETATLLYELANGNANTKNSTSSKTDAVSFAHALRACRDESALEDYEAHRSGDGSATITRSRKEQEAFANLALAVARRVWKGLETEHEQQLTHSQSQSQSQSQSTDDRSENENENESVRIRFRNPVVFSNQLKDLSSSPPDTVVTTKVAPAGDTTNETRTDPSNPARAHRSGDGSATITRSRKEQEAFANLALAVARRVWKGLETEHEQQLTHSQSQSQSQSTRRDHLSDLLDENPVYNNNSSSSSSNSEGLLNSFHFLHMLRVGRNFATLRRCSAAREIDNDNDNEDHHETTATIHDRHRDWMTEVMGKCIEHQAVNIHVLQEVMYQGAVVLGEEEHPRGVSSAKTETALDWVRVIVLDSLSSSLKSSSSSSIPVANWEMEILPRLLSVRQKQQQQQQQQLDPRARRKLELVYARTIQQSRELLRFLPSNWRIRAE
eukprot:CAMPEP_0172409566 /NCGR_PEP_ID=MMETSP1061-20121228/76430_1 /TAXON_ID=37318 /ORGANISM="Pseudo-nitzschia pungens, Strain cf. pungens" /LENGTH=815 /DNA_ID=CAMNT_0013145721 /DNA_START=832 /DNA_END=3280 /DNA_ORIENTATION=+